MPQSAIITWRLNINSIHALVTKPECIISKPFSNFLNCRVGEKSVGQWTASLTFINHILICTITGRAEKQWVLFNYNYTSLQSSCLHRASMIIKHFFIQIMHNIQYVDTIKTIKIFKRAPFKLCIILIVSTYYILCIIWIKKRLIIVINLHAQNIASQNTVNKPHIYLL